MLYQTSQEAFAAGEALLKKLGNPDWVVHVWANLGWHCEIRNPGGEFIAIQETMPGYYSAFYEPHSIVTGSSVVSPGAAFEDLKLKYTEAYRFLQQHWEKVQEAWVQHAGI